MPRRPQARETRAKALQREIDIADALCRQEEANISDAETLDSDYVTESSSSDGSYESDFIDDSDISPDEIREISEWPMHHKSVKFSAKTKHIK